MTGDNLPFVIASVGFLVLVASSLVARRLPLSQWVRYSAAWVGILGLLYIGFLFRDDVGTLWERARADITGSPTIESDGSAITLALEDGHFWATGSTTTGDQNFLVDSGATTTVISQAGAERLGVVAEAGYPVMVETANGRTMTQRGTIGRLAVGSITVVDLPVLISTNGDDVNVLGMNWLNRMASWRVEGRRMTIVPQSAAGSGGNGE
jgi:aspartyl protease family protein